METKNKIYFKIFKDSSIIWKVKQCYKIWKILTNYQIKKILKIVIIINKIKNKAKLKLKFNYKTIVILKYKLTKNKILKK